jgi:hypothetical protein
MIRGGLYRRSAQATTVANTTTYPSNPAPRFATHTALSAKRCQWDLVEPGEVGALEFGQQIDQFRRSRLLNKG